MLHFWKLVRKRQKGMVFQNPEEGQAFAANFKRLRNQQGFTMQRLADEADVDKSTIVRIESAKLNITIDLAFTLSKTLKLDPKELFNFKLP